jgi:hypothetical protein
MPVTELTMMITICKAFMTLDFIAKWYAHFRGVMQQLEGALKAFIHIVLRLRKRS